MWLTLQNGPQKGALQFALLCGAALAVAACGKEPESKSGANVVLQDPAIREASGLALSRLNAGILWTHNDSHPRLFAVNLKGQTVASFHLPGNAGGDFEDLAIGPGPRDGIDYLFLGDIGDNDANRDSIAVLRCIEPALGAPGGAASGKLADLQKIVLLYPDGPRNAESLLVDPLSGDLFIFSKEKKKSRVYTATKAQLETGLPERLSFVCELGFGSASGAAISRDGTRIALRSEDAGRVWPRKAADSVAQALLGVPAWLPLIGRPREPNGEAITFKLAGDGYFTLSEGVAPTLYSFSL